MKVTFIRHCECYIIDKNGVPNFMRVDPSLTYDGRERAKNISGSYDFVIISPMIRCLETFLYSKIQTKQREIREEFRELRLCPGDFRQNDPPEITAETLEMFHKRIQCGRDYLKTLQNQYRNICVITHSEWMKEALNLSQIPDYGESVTIDFP